MAKILVIGGGAMGSAFTIPCLDNKNNVTITEPYSKQFINNLKSKNSMVLGFHPQLQSKIDEAENSKDINSIIIFGEGGFFCAGGDLNSLKTRRDMTVPERLETLEQLNETIKKIKECSKPTIAAVEGGAAGAGVSLAMACDFLIMSDKLFASLDRIVTF